MSKQRSILADQSEPAYSLLFALADQNDIPIRVVNIVDKLFNDEAADFDASEDFEVICLAPGIYQLLDLITQTLILSVSDENIKSQLWQTLQNDRTVNGQLTIDKGKIEAISSTIGDGEQADTVREELTILAEEMDKVAAAAGLLKEAVMNSRHKIFYDYIGTLQDPQGGLAVANETYLEQELAKIRQIEEILSRPTVLDKKLVELPTINSQIKELALLPLGFRKSIPTGTYGYDLIKILQRADRVTTYFLQKLKPQSTSSSERYYKEPDYEPYAEAEESGEEVEEYVDLTQPAENNQVNPAEVNPVESNNQSG